MCIGINITMSAIRAFTKSMYGFSSNIPKTTRASVSGVLKRSPYSALCLSGINLQVYILDMMREFFR